MSNFFKRHTPLFENPSSFQELNPGECCIDDVFLSDAVIALNGAVWELTLTLNDGTTHVAPLPPTFTDVYVTSFARHPDALTIPALVNTIRITLSDLTTFDLDLTFLVGGGEDLAATLVLGNITGGLDIVTSDDDVIKAATGGGQLDLRHNTTDNAILFDTDNGSYSQQQLYLENGVKGYIELSDYSVGGNMHLIADNIKIRTNAAAGPTEPNSISIYSGHVDAIIILGVGVGYDAIKITELQGIGNVTTNAEKSSVVIASQNSYPDLSVNNSAILGGLNIVANTDNTAYANQISLQQAGNTFNTFIVPSPVTLSDKTATVQDKTGTLAYLSDISGGPSVFNIYNQDGTLTADRFIDGNSRTHRITFFDLSIFQVSTTDLVTIKGGILQIGGITSVSIATPNTIALLGKVGQVLTLNTITGGCDWEDKYFAVTLDSADPLVTLSSSPPNYIYTITHNLNSLDIKPEVFRLSDGATVGTSIKRISVNQVTVRIKAPSNPNGQYRVII